MTIHLLRESSDSHNIDLEKIYLILVLLGEITYSYLKALGVAESCHLYHRVFDNS